MLERNYYNDGDLDDYTVAWYAERGMQIRPEDGLIACLRCGLPAHGRMSCEDAATEEACAPALGEVTDYATLPGMAGIRARSRESARKIATEDRIRRE